MTAQIQVSIAPFTILPSGLYLTEENKVCHLLVVDSERKPIRILTQGGLNNFLTWLPDLHEVNAGILNR